MPVGTKRTPDSESRVAAAIERTPEVLILNQVGINGSGRYPDKLAYLISNLGGTAKTSSQFLGRGLFI